MSSHPEGYANSELAKLDLTALDWSPTLDPSSAIVGQQVDVHLEDLVYMITYIDSIPGEPDLKTTYSFDAERDFAPLSVETLQGDAVVQLILYGYPDVQLADICVPAVVVQGTIQESGFVETIIREIHDWSLESDRHSTDLRVPPVYLKVDMTDSHSPPITQVVFPSHLQGIDPSKYLEVATQYILGQFGTDDAEADYDFDGQVTEQDVYAAMELLQG